MQEKQVFRKSPGLFRVGESRAGHHGSTAGWFHFVLFCFFKSDSETSLSCRPGDAPETLSCLCIEKIMTLVVMVIRESNATDCDCWVFASLFSVFCPFSSLKVKQAEVSGSIPAGSDGADGECGNEHRRAILLVTFFLFSKLCHFCPFYVGSNQAFLLQDQMLSILLGICQGNQ